MLPTISGCVHLSVTGGCGGTTWGLQYAREALSVGNHVVWICEDMPDGDRFSQIFSNLSAASVSRFHLSVVGENTEVGIKSAIGLLQALDSISLVVVDDWTAKIGKVKSANLKAMCELVSDCTARETSMIAISSSYEDANGTGWKARGSLKDCETWFLHRSSMDSMVRELHIDGEVTEYILGDEGFTPRK